MAQFHPHESYDYIVVGSGASGAVVAARLSENPAHQVLLIEAGPDDTSPWIGVPLGFARVLANPDYMWRYESGPEKALDNRSLAMWRGKLLGGSTSVNGMIYLRGAPYDYDLWRQMGAVGWSYEDVLPYFRKAETQSRGADEHHGGTGPLHVEDVRWRTPLSDAFIDASASAGVPRIHDFNREDIEGVGYFQFTTHRGSRASTARTYLKSARRRRNLAIMTKAVATHIELENGVAKTVCLSREGTTLRVSARAEIILSCGALGTPQLLERSGIGDPAMLRQLGIPVRHDLSGVGKNLMEHLLVKRSYLTTSRHTLNAIMANPLAQLSAGLRYGLGKSGPLAAGPAPAGGLACTRPGLPAPDINFLFHPFEVDNFGTNLARESSFQISFFPLRPESRGHVHISSADHRDAPIVTPNFLDTPDDIRTALDALRLIGKIGRSPSLAPFGPKEVLPDLAEETDEALLAYIRANATAAFHSAGSCRMGEDALAVVDPQLRVRGIAGLRVADASIMPAMPSGALNAICIMIGEKCADMIKSAEPQ